MMSKVDTQLRKKTDSLKGVYKAKNMKKNSLIIRIIVASIALLMILAGCATPDRSQAIVAKVNDIPIYRWELDAVYNKSKTLYEENAGYKLDDPKNNEKKVEYRKRLLDMLIDDTIATEAAKQEGYDLTDTEKDSFEKEFAQFKQDNINNYMENKFKDDAKAEQKAKAAWDESLSKNGMTEEQLKQSEYNGKVREKLAKELFKDTTPSEDELLVLYDEMIQIEEGKYADAKEKYAEEYAVNAAIPGDKTIIFNPAGFMRVKQIMISLPNEIDQEIRKNSLESGDLIKEQSDIAKEKGKNDPAVAQLQTQIDDLKKKNDELYEKGYEQIKPKVEEAYNKVKAGEDFEDLIQEYGDDPGMLDYPISKYGYLVGAESKQLVEGFRKAALSLKKEGDVSEPGKSINGYHIIKAIKMIEEGSISFEEAKPFLIDFGSISPRNETLDEYVKSKRDTVKVETFPENV